MKYLKFVKYLFLLVLFSVSLNSFAQDDMLRMGYYYTEDEATMKLKEFGSTWNDLESWEKRAAMIKDGVIKGMKLDKMPKIEGNFNPQITNTRIFDGYIVENIRIESFPGFYITGNIYRPVEVPKQKSAGILLAHGHSDNGRMVGFRQVQGAVLARMGAVVFAYDMIGCGDSRQVNSHRSIPIALLLQTWNSRRVLEYMLSRPDIDPERIGMTGSSGGGTQTFILAAIDDRIKVSVPMSIVSANHYGGCICESGMPIHKSNHHETNNVEIAALCAPRYMLLVSDGIDWTRTTTRIEYPYIQKVYALYNAENRIDNAHFPELPHATSYIKRAVMYNFFAVNLKLDTDKVSWSPSISEDFVTILPEGQLNVYTEDNPMPGDALMGDEAIMKYLGLD